MELLVEKCIRGWICHAIHWYVKTNNKYMKAYGKNKSYLKYWHVNNLHGWAMPQKLSVNGFDCVKETSHFDESFYRKLQQRKW